MKVFGSKADTCSLQALASGGSTMQSDIVEVESSWNASRAFGRLKSSRIGAIFTSFMITH